jgi:DNA-binding MarR family transcriptional regulator
MAGDKPLQVTGSVAFQASMLGRWAGQQFEERVAALEIRPRHVAVLELLREGARSQLDVAKALGVTPSVVVDMLDELERLGAVRRTRNAEDRRRQAVVLTTRGRSLADRCVSISYEIDAVMMESLSAADRKSFHSALTKTARALGLPCSAPDDLSAGKAPLERNAKRLSGDS